ncbi:hypothetical protein BaRGS_00017026 [Batillaria attramentaria]|uniref:Uncharacterized protein n=1 Tax=Batillaria attramentaria TaxID=370345 RepID=A0ABD0KY77_9CAEN
MLQTTFMEQVATARKTFAGKGKGQFEVTAKGEKHLDKSRRRFSLSGGRDPTDLTTRPSVTATGASRHYGVSRISLPSSGKKVLSSCQFNGDEAFFPINGRSAEQASDRRLNTLVMESTGESHSNSVRSLNSDELRTLRLTLYVVGSRASPVIACSDILPATLFDYAELDRPAGAKVLLI